MFNRYWRTYPWVLQLTLLMLMILTLSSFATYLVLTLVPRLSGIALDDLINLTPVSSTRATRAGIIAQGISHLGTFALPALLFAVFCHPRVREYLGIRAPGKPQHWLMATGIMVGLVPVFLWGEAWMLKHLHFGNWATERQAANDNTFKAFLKLKTGPDLALLLTILALLPAIGEELLFRGAMLRLFHRRVYKVSPPVVEGDKAVVPDAQRSMLFPVIFTALLFAVIHVNPYGFVFIFIAGCMLSLIYYLTGSLLCAIWAHFLYNGIQVASVFLTHHNDAARIVAENDQLPPIYPIAGLVIFALSFYALVRTQTPLAADWSLDFKPGEEGEEGGGSR